VGVTLIGSRAAFVGGFCSLCSDPMERDSCPLFMPLLACACFLIAHADHPFPWQAFCHSLWAVELIITGRHFADRLIFVCFRLPTIRFDHLAPRASPPGFAPSFYDPSLLFLLRSQLILILREF